MTDPTFLRIPLNEWKRKAVHMGCFGFAFLLPYITPTQAALGAIGAFCFNAFLLPRLMPSILRPDENGKATGLLEVILYPAAILATILAFGINFWPDSCEWWSANCRHQDIFYPSAASTFAMLVGIVWFSLAIMDGIYGLAHQSAFLPRKLPWNPRKTVGGLLSGWLLIALVLLLLEYLVMEQMSGTVEAWVLILLIGVVESCWFGIADNLTIPFSMTLLLGMMCSMVGHSAILLFFQPRDGGPWRNFLPFIPFIFAGGVLLVKKVTAGGAMLGLIISIFLMSANPGLFLFLAGFFALGVVATKYGYEKKLMRGIAEARSGARGAAEVFGAAGMAAWLTPLPIMHLSLSGASVESSFRYLLIVATPLIAKTMDTVSSEIGKAVGGKTVSLMNFKLVPPGTAGAVSLAGTLWGIAAAALLAALIFPLHWGGLAQWGILIAIAVAANLFESYWGAWASPRGLDDGPHTNFLMTLFAAVLAWFVWGR